MILGVGVWQNPEQLAEALLHVGATLRVRRYLEVGVFSGWTCAVARLRMFKKRGGFHRL